MHVHAAVMKVKDDADPAVFDSVVAKLASIKGQVDGVLEVYGGPNKSDNPSSEYTHAIVVLMESHSVLARYREHPAHESAIPDLVSIVDGGFGLDIGDA
jgi:hypothetical protein